MRVFVSFLCVIILLSAAPQLPCRAAPDKNTETLDGIIKLQHAHRLYGCGQYRAAKELYIQILQEDPSAKEVLLYLGSLCKEIYDYENAAGYFRRYLSYRADSRVLFALAETYFLDGRLKEADEYLTRLIAAHSDWKAFFLSGLIYEVKGDYEKALGAYRASLAEKKNSNALYRIGKIHFSRQDYPAAVRAFSDLVSFDPSVRLACVYLGRAYMQQRNKTESYRYLERALSFYPDNRAVADDLQLAKKALGREYFLKKRKESFDKRKALTLFPYTPPSRASAPVRVGIIKEAARVHFKCATSVKVYSGTEKGTLTADTFYTLKVHEGSVAIFEYEADTPVVQLPSPVRFESQNGPFYVLGVRFGHDQFWNVQSDITVRGSLEVISAGDVLTVVNVLSMEEYLYGVLPSEIYASVDEKALMAQAVAARTIAYKNKGRHKAQGFDFCPDVHCQAYRGMTNETQRTNRAVDATRGQIMVFHDEPIETFYHANCGGCLRSDLFGPREYLKTKKDSSGTTLALFSPWDSELWFWGDDVAAFSSHTSRSSNFRWQRVYDAEDFLLAFDVPMDELDDITITRKGDCEHIDALDVTISNAQRTIEGDLNVRRFFDNLRSSAFRPYLARQAAGGPVRFLLIYGAGFGHGVGMSQEGMVAMAKQGYSYKEILAHYYDGVDVETVY